MLKQWHLGVERASYEASRAERRYRAVDPDNRLVARGLGARVGGEPDRPSKPRKPNWRATNGNAHACSCRKNASSYSRSDLDLAKVWHAPTTTPRDRKELLRMLIEEVIVRVERDKIVAHLTIPLERRCAR